MFTSLACWATTIPMPELLAPRQYLCRLISHAEIQAALRRPLISPSSLAGRFADCNASHVSTHVPVDLRTAPVDAYPAGVFPMALAAVNHEGRTAWGLSIRNGDHMASAVDSCSTVDALILGLQEVLSHPAFKAAEHILLRCDDAEFHERVSNLPRTLGPVYIEPLRSRKEADALRDAAQDAALIVLGIDPETWRAETQDAAPPVYVPLRELTVATDASWNSTGRGQGKTAAYGWYSDNHAYGAGLTRGPILFAELKAAQMALENSQFQRRDIHLLMDSQKAIAVLRRLQAGEEVSGIASLPSGRDAFNLLNRLKVLISSRTHGLRVSWVKGHSGHPLNEAADRLALSYRRNHQFGFGAEECDRRTHEIAADICAELGGADAPVSGRHRVAPAPSSKAI